MNSFTLNTTSELNTIKIVSFPKLGEMILRFYLSKTEKQFTQLNKKLSELDFAISEVKTQIDFVDSQNIIEFEELYYLINFFYLFLGELNVHRYYNLRCIISETLNLTQSIKTKISLLQELVNIEDNLLLKESKYLSNTLLSLEWDNAEEDIIWNEYFATN